MAEVNANSLPAKTDLGTNDSAIVVDQTTNAGALVDLDVLADKVLDRITSKTFANQVGGSSAATLLAQLSTLNSKIMRLGGATASSPFSFGIGGTTSVVLITTATAAIDISMHILRTNTSRSAIIQKAVLASENITLSYNNSTHTVTVTSADQSNEISVFAIVLSGSVSV